MHILETSSSSSSNSREFHSSVCSQMLRRSYSGCRSREEAGCLQPDTGQLHVHRPNAPACNIAHMVSLIAMRPAMPDFMLLQQRKTNNAACSEWPQAQVEVGMPPTCVACVCPSPVSASSSQSCIHISRQCLAKYPSCMTLLTRGHGGQAG